MDVGSYLITGGFTLLATLSGVIVANLFQAKRLRTQLAHDRELKNREREMSLRKDVYLAGVEAVYAGLLAVNQFANLETPHEKIIEGYLDKAPSLAKVHIIAKEETVKTLVAFTAALDTVFVRLFARRGPLVFEKQRIDVLRAQAEQRQSMEAKQEADKLTVALYIKQLQLMEDSVGEKNNLVRLLILVVFSIRKELELPIEEAEYRRVLEAAASEQLNIFKDYLQEHVLRHLKSYPGTSRCAICQSYPPRPHGADPRREHGDRRHGATVEVRVSTRDVGAVSAGRAKAALGLAG